MQFLATCSGVDAITYSRMHLPAGILSFGNPLTLHAWFCNVKRLLRLVLNLVSGSCIAAGYLRCCEDGEAQCLGSPATCSCHASCNVTGDCCKDIDQLDCNYGK